MARAKLSITLNNNTHRLLLSYAEASKKSPSDILENALLSYITSHEVADREKLAINMFSRCEANLNLIAKFISDRYHEDANRH